MIDSLFSSIAPHYCCGCGRIGVVLCDDCKYNIISESLYACILCGKNGNQDGICIQCCPPYERVWCVGVRTGVLQRLVGDYKFQGVREAHRALGDLLLETLPSLPSNTVIVPVPTVGSHIRERGYDHALLIARYVAKRRGLKVVSLLRRRTSTKQRDASRADRITQAKNAFETKAVLSEDVPYLLIDDVITTGATIKYASKTLRRAGAVKVWVAAIARQPLD